MITALVINLARRADRRREFERHNARSGLDIEFVEAVDGKTLEYDSLVDQRLLAESARVLPPAVVGCALSHMRLWQRCSEENTPCLVFEDDAIVRQDFVKQYQRLGQLLPGDWDYLSLACNFDSIIRFEILPGLDFHGEFTEPHLDARQLESFSGSQVQPELFRLKNQFGLCAYAVSPKGARTMLDKCFPLEVEMIEIPVLETRIPSAGIDAVLNLYWSGLQAFCSIPPLAVSPNDPRDSDLVNSSPAPGGTTVTLAGNPGEAIVR